jgi:lipoate-protein ligase B
LIALQNRVLADLRPVRGSAILFAELPSTITLGARQALDPSLLQWIPSLKLRGIEIETGERGGNETWHGPGQWVGFVLTPLQEFTGDSKGVRLAVHQTLELLMPTVRTYVPDAKIEEGSRLGIWSEEGKLASIGIKIRDGYTSSGFALNCIPNPDAFPGIHPCGIPDAKPDFLFRQSVDAESWSKEFLKIPDRIAGDFSVSPRR